MVTAAERVVKLLGEINGDWLCDDCIAQRMGFSKRQQANQITNALATTQEYTRGISHCLDCGGRKLVTCRA